MLGRVGLLALQRSAGNAAVAQLLRRAPATSLTVQRDPDPGPILNIAKRLDKLIQALRANPASLPEYGVNHLDDVNDLEEDATQAGLGSSNERGIRLLRELQELARLKDSTAEVTALLAGLDSAALSFDRAAATTFTPTLSPQGGRVAAATQPTDSIGGKKVRESAGAMKLLQGAEAKRLESKESLIEARIMLTVAALARAYAHHHSARHGHDAGTFLIFLGPEFWFRDITGGPCEPWEAEHVKDTFRAVSLLYPDVLIVPGTIVSGWHDDPPPGHSRVWHGVRNTAPAFWNGSLIHEVDKEGDAGTTSGIDLITGETTAESAQTKGTGTSFFTLGHLRIAIDICVDHYNRRAAKEVERGAVAPADIHLVTAGGQTVSSDQVALAAHPQTLGLSADSAGSGGAHLADGINTPEHGEILDEMGAWKQHQGYEWTKNAPQKYWPPVRVGAQTTSRPRGRIATPPVDYDGSGRAAWVPGRGGSVVDRQDGEKDHWRPGSARRRVSDAEGEPEKGEGDDRQPEKNRRDEELEEWLRRNARRRGPPLARESAHRIAGARESVSDAGPP